MPGGSFCARSTKGRVLRKSRRVVESAAIAVAGGGHVLREGAGEVVRSVEGEGGAHAGEGAGAVAVWKEVSAISRHGSRA